MSQPVIRELGAMNVIGVGGRFISVLSPDHTNFPVIPALWDDYGKRSGEIGKKRPDVSLGVVVGLPGDEARHPYECHYIAGAEVDSLEAIPEGMEGIVIPPATYAVFTHRGAIERIGESYGRIHAEWFPASDYQRASGPEFELYDERFRHDFPLSEMDIYIPVTRRR